MAFSACTGPPELPEAAGASSGDEEAAVEPLPRRGPLLDLDLARQAEEEGNLAAALTHLRSALAGAPHHPIFLQTTARALAAQGLDAEALELLQRLVDLGAVVDLGASERWGSLAGSEQLEAFRVRLSGADAALPVGEVAVTFEDAELYPEGIAWDRVSGAFFVGSMTRSKIVRVDADGEQRDLVTSNQDGLLNPLGMAVDAERRGLWVASTAYPPHGGATTEDAGRSAVFQFDVDSGELRQRFPLDERPRRHFLNDLDVNEAGEVFITDSETTDVYHIPAGGSELQVLLTLPEVNFMNGLALSDDERHLYIAHLEGMTRIDLVTREAVRVAEAASVAIAHGDGIAFFRDSLVVIQNQAFFGFRIARFRLDETGARAEHMQVLHAGLVDQRLPYTGVVAGDRFYVSMSADLDDREMSSAAPLILSVPLAEPASR